MDPIMRRSFLLSLLAGVVSVGGSLRAADAPNIMIFLVDDMGVMDTSVPFLTDDEGKPKRYPLNDRTPSDPGPSAGREPRG